MRAGARGWRTGPRATGAAAGFTIDGVHLSARGADVVAAAFRDLIGALRAERPGRG